MPNAYKDKSITYLMEIGEYTLERTYQEFNYNTQPNMRWSYAIVCPSVTIWAGQVDLHTNTSSIQYIDIKSYVPVVDDVIPIAMLVTYAQLDMERVAHELHSKGLATLPLVPARYQDRLAKLQQLLNQKTAPEPDIQGTRGPSQKPITHNAKSGVEVMP